MTRVAGQGQWRAMPFSDLAENVSDRIDDPSKAGVDRYVGLEHLDSGSLSIKRWGSPSDVEATKLRFKTGDVIFGRRRAYQRKVARADFEGICSAHAMVLRARPHNVLPEFLPFFMQSEVFFERALAISVGSLSPTINWKALASETFRIPSLEYQQHLAVVLRAAVAVTESWRAVEERLQGVVDAAVAETLKELPDEVSCPLGEGVLDVKYGTSTRCGAEEVGMVPVLRIPNVVSGDLDLSDLKWAKLTEREITNYAVRSGDLLLVRTNGNPDYVARGTLVNQLAPTPLAYASYLLRVRVRHDRLRPSFLALVLRNPRTRAALKHLIRSSAGNYNLSATGLQSLRIPMPALAVQDELVGRAEELRDQAETVESHVRASERLYTALREEWLNDPAL
jgi:type I restriction enzyme, S subunit